MSRAMIVTFHPPPHLTMQLAGRDAPRVARRAIGALVADADADTRSSAILVTSELVTNAIQAAFRCAVSGWYLPNPGAIRIEVADSSPDLPVLRQRGDQRVGGHGLRIVDQLTARWGVTTNEVGKTVWAELATKPPPS